MKIDRKGLVFVLVLALLFYTLGSVMGANMNMGMIYHAQAGSGDGGTWNVSGTDIYLNETYTEVGIGITSPTYELHVVGDIFASAFFGDGGNLTNISGVGGNVFDQDLNTTNDVVFNSTTSSFHGDGGNLTNVSSKFWNTSQNILYLNGTTYDRVGIGTATPSYEFHIYDANSHAWFEVETGNTGSYAGCYFTRPDASSYVSLFFQTESTAMWNLGMRPNGKEDFYFRNVFTNNNLMVLNSTDDIITVNGEIHSSSFHGDGGNLTNVSATIPDTYYGSFYLAQNGLSSIGAGEQVLLLNATSKNSDDTVFYLNNNWVTINHTGTFLVTGECYWNSGGSTRSEYTMWLRELTDDEILGTRSGIYARGYDSGSTGAFSIIIDVTSGDQYCLAIELTDGAGSSGYQDDYGTRLTFVEL